MLYRQRPEKQPRIVIPVSLVPRVLAIYHDLPFTVHQRVGRTAEFIKKKYWWDTLVSDAREYIRTCDACAKRKRGHKVTAPLDDQLEAKECLHVVS